jgi:tetratricopeptide (TPR) repeat protein
MWVPPRNRNYVDRVQVLEAVRRLAGAGDGNVIALFKGLAGVGKTAVATHLAYELEQMYPDGRLYFSLSDGLDDAVSESDCLMEALVALGDRQEDIPDRLEARRNRYWARTAGRRLMVVIDGAVTAGQVRTLQPAEGQSLVMVTERRPAMDLSAGGVLVFELPRLDDDSARELLTRIVGAERAAAEPEAFDRLLAICDNLPRALCIVGELVRQRAGRSIAAVADLLRAEKRRSEVLATLFEVVYRELDATAARCYRALGIRSHAGFVGVPALAAVLGLPADDIAWAMRELADLCLVDESDRGYRAADIVRRHARSIDDRGEGERAEDENRWLRYYDQHIGAADVLLAPARPWRALLLHTSYPRSGTPEFGTADQARAWLRREMPNIVAATEYAFAAGRDDLVARWCVLLWAFHEKEKNLDAMHAMHESGVAAARRSGNHAVCSLLSMQIGFRHYWLRELDAAAAALATAVRLARQLPVSAAAVQLEASALEGLGLVRVAQGRPGDAREALRRNHQIAGDIGDPRRIALAAFHLAKAEEPAGALELLDQAETIFAHLDVDETENLAKVQGWRGRKLVEQGRADPARQPLLAALAVMRERRRRFDEAEILVALGDCARALADAAEAVRCYQGALEIYTELCFGELVAEVQARIADSPG